MTLPQAAPEEGGKRRGEHFSHAATEANQRWSGWIAGPTMWFWCHQPMRTKPCLKRMTAGAVECPWCGNEKEVVKRGYVPLYRAIDTTPRCIIVNDLYEEVTAKFELHERVTVGKEGEKGDPVWIMRAITQTPAFQSTLRHRFQPVDLTDSLLRIWGSAELRKWYAEISRPSDNAVSLPNGTAVRANGEPVSPMLQAAAKRQGFPVVTDPIGTGDPESDAEREFLKAVQEGRASSTNGHAKKPRPKRG